MIINHNMNSIIAYNRANAIEGKKNSAMEKLSSGLRVNSAADDAAGASISEKMKAQIRGLEQAGKNIQDGISLVQTAEAGLGSIQNPNLIRMRELVEQALNGTLTQEDRMKIQTELDQIKGNIDDIANYTEFNTTKVLSPPSELTPPAPSGKADVVFVIDDTGSMGPIQDNVKNNLESFISSVKAQGVDDVRIGLERYSDNNFQEVGFGGGSLWTSDTTQVGNAIQNIIDNPYSGGTENLMTALTKVANDYDFRDNENGASMKHVIYVTNENADDASGLQSSTIALLQSKGIQVHGVFDKTFYEGVSDLNSLVSDTGGVSIDLNDSNWGSELSSILGAHIGDAGKFVNYDKMPTLNLQVGANSGEQFQVELFDARTHKLGIKDISVDTIDNAKEALDKVDQAIEMVSKQRSKFGAYQNALEHIGNNVGNYGDNMTSAQSRISDADMAKEVMEMTKNSILEESAQSMLKQAEKMSEGIINLMSKWQPGESGN